MHHVRRSRALVAAVATIAVVTGGAAATAGAAPEPARRPAALTEPTPADLLGDVAIGRAVAVEREAPGAPSSTVVLPGS